MTVFTAEEIAKGMDRLGTYPEAKFLRQHLMTILLAATSPGVSDGALRHIEGRRNLASELIASLGLSRGAATSGDGTGDGSEYANGSASTYTRAHAGIHRRVPERLPEPKSSA